ncbi:MAG: transposase family protein [Deltaproteobacteria bacterium]|nr:transposase family protein [Deltaproteobacteria bacterium]
MRDHEFYARILGLTAPWSVERVELNVARDAVHVWPQRASDAPATRPECHSTQTIYDHREREWRHLDTCQLQTRLHARVPLIDCPTHGVLQSPVPWAVTNSSSGQRPTLGIVSPAVRRTFDENGAKNAYRPGSRSATPSASSIPCSRREPWWRCARRSFWPKHSLPWRIPPSCATDTTSLPAARAEPALVRSYGRRCGRALPRGNRVDRLFADVAENPLPSRDPLVVETHELDQPVSDVHPIERGAHESDQAFEV